MKNLFDKKEIIKRWELKDGPPFPSEPTTNIRCDEDFFLPIRPNQKPYNFKITHYPGCGCQQNPS